MTPNQNAAAERNARNHQTAMNLTFVIQANATLALAQQLLAAPAVGNGEIGYDALSLIHSATEILATVSSEMSVRARIDAIVSLGEKSEGII